MMVNNHLQVLGWSSKYEYQTHLCYKISPSVFVVQLISNGRSLHNIPIRTAWVPFWASRAFSIAYQVPCRLLAFFPSKIERDRISTDPYSKEVAIQLWDTQVVQGPFSGSCWRFLGRFSKLKLLGESAKNVSISCPAWIVQCPLIRANLKTSSILILVLFFLPSQLVVVSGWSVHLRDLASIQWEADLKQVSQDAQFAQNVSAMLAYLWMA